MKYFLLILVLFGTLSFASEPNAPESITVEGKMEFMTLGNNNKLLIEKLNKSFQVPADARGCIFAVIAEDEFYTSYPGTLDLRLLEDDSYALMYRSKAKWIDENGSYWAKKITSVELKVHNTNTDSWKNHARGNNEHVIYATDIDQGFSFFHNITMGQPVTVNITKVDNPKNIKINVKPLNSKLAKHARDCIKAINREL